MKAIEQNHCRWQFPSICRGRKWGKFWQKESWKLGGGVWARTDNRGGSVLQQAADNKWQRCQRRCSPSSWPPPLLGHLPPGHPYPGRSRPPSTSCAAGQRISVQCEIFLGPSSDFGICLYPNLRFSRVSFSNRSGLCISASVSLSDFCLCRVSYPAICINLQPFKWINWKGPWVSGTFQVHLENPSGGFSVRTHKPSAGYGIPPEIG